MEDLFKHPDIINPHLLEKDSAKDRAFVFDIGIDALLAQVPFYSQDTKELAKAVIVDMDSDVETVRYRQEVLQELMTDANLRNEVRAFVKRLNNLEYKLAGFGDKTSLQNGLSLLRTYKESFDTPVDFRTSNSQALKEVGSYLHKIRGSERFTALCGLLDLLENAAEVDFRVSLDRDGSPVMMFALELVKGTRAKPGIISIIERLAGKKRHEQSLRGYGGPNNLGRVIQEYMDRQFIPLVKAYISQIREVIELLKPMDYYSGFAEYFTKLAGEGIDICQPKLMTREERKMKVRTARNPLLLETTTSQPRTFWRHRTVSAGERIVPNDISYDADKNLFIITGPNNGGKTTYVKTVGLIQLMSQKGLFVPAQSAEVSFVDGVYTHFVAPEDITKGEGRYRNELRRMKDILERASPYSLVILDEPCGGTSYEEGLRQSLALLDGFHKLGPATYFTTHMHLVAREVDSGRYIAAKNLSVECLDDGKKVTYTYKVKEGASDRSYGEEIAREVGLMPEHIIETVSRRAEEKGYGDILRK